MSEREPRSRVEFHYDYAIDFEDLDPAVLPEIVRRLTDAAFLFNLQVVTDFGGRVGPERQDGLTNQAIAAAFQMFDEHDPHPDPFEKAAVILRGITQGHPFDDGNKRTGFLTAVYYLEQIGHELPEGVTTVEIVALCLRISAGEMREIGEITAELRKLYRLETR